MSWLEGSRARLRLLFGRRAFESRTDEEWALDKINGKIYGVPLLNQGGAEMGNYIRKDWLDKLKLNMPS